MEKYKNKYNGVVKVDDTTTRNKNIIITSIIGIVTNFFLALFKAIVGFLSGSISIVLDSVNNISDVASSVITIIGTRLATKEPDKEHPFGHGRMEYLSSLIISIIILYAGFTSIIESIKKLINPGKLEYTVFSIVVVIIDFVENINKILPSPFTFLGKLYVPIPSSLVTIIIILLYYSKKNR